MIKQLSRVNSVIKTSTNSLYGTLRCLVLNIDLTYRLRNLEMAGDRGTQTSAMAARHLRTVYKSNFLGSNLSFITGR